MQQASTPKCTHLPTSKHTQMYPLACCLLTPTSKHTLRVKPRQTLTHYESNPTSKQQATLQLVACLLSRANVVSGNKQTTP